MAALGATNPTNWIVPKTAIKKFVGSFVATLLYYNKSKSKNSFYRQSKYKKSQEISNLRLASRAARGEPVFPYKAARSAAETLGKKDESLILEHLYYQIRTYFERN